MPPFVPVNAIFDPSGDHAGFFIDVTPFTRMLSWMDSDSTSQIVIWLSPSL